MSPNPSAKLTSLLFWLYLTPSRVFNVATVWRNRLFAFQIGWQNSVTIYVSIWSLFLSDCYFEYCICKLLDLVGWRQKFSPAWISVHDKWYLYLCCLDVAKATPTYLLPSPTPPTPVSLLSPSDSSSLVKEVMSNYHHLFTTNGCHHLSVHFSIFVLVQTSTTFCKVALQGELEVE